MSLRTLTFEGTDARELKNITSELNAPTIILVSSKVITSSAAYESISLEIGTTINTFNVVDDDTKNFYLKHSLHSVAHHVVGEFVSQYEPNIGFKAGGNLNRTFYFNLRKPDGDLLDNLIYYFFQFQIIE